jgi:TatD DNase family protein
MLIDSHCHLNFKAYKKNLREVINNAQSNDVKKIVVPGAKLDSSKKAVEIAQQYDGIYAAVGIHPHHAQEEIVKLLNGQAVKNELEKLAKSKKVVAIGECGLDYHQTQNSNVKSQNYNLNLKTKKIQKELFLSQLELANKLHLPVIIHNRDADEDMLKTLITNYQLLITNSGVFHCFMGGDELLTWALNHNFYIGITGLITYNQRVQDIVAKTPLEKLLIETDSPFLTPEPLRTQRIFPNRPENVKIVAQWIAKIKGDSFLKVARVTSKNAIQLFKLD